MSLDICPGFWDWLLATHEAGKCFLVDAVRTELQRQHDALASWSQEAPPSFFLKESQNTPGNIQYLVRWAGGEDFTPVARSDFEDSADIVLVAQAKELGYKVVSEELRQDDRRNCVKVPNACAALGNQCITPIEFFRNEGLRLVRATVP
jgi:hypothetical protein